MTERRNLRQGVSTSQNKALPATGVCQSLLPTILSSREILKYWTATRYVTSYMNVVITSYKISPYTAHSRGALLQGIVLRLTSHVQVLRFQWLLGKFWAFFFIMQLVITRPVAPQMMD